MPQYYGCVRFFPLARLIWRLPGLVSSSKTYHHNFQLIMCHIEWNTIDKLVFIYHIDSRHSFHRSFARTLPLLLWLSHLRSLFTRPAMRGITNVHKIWANFLSTLPASVCVSFTSIPFIDSRICSLPFLGFRCVHWIDKCVYAMLFNTYRMTFKLCTLIAAANVCVCVCVPWPLSIASDLQTSRSATDSN